MSGSGFGIQAFSVSEGSLIPWLSFYGSFVWDGYELAFAEYDVVAFDYGLVFIVEAPVLEVGMESCLILCFLVVWCYFPSNEVTGLPLYVSLALLRWFCVLVLRYYCSPVWSLEVSAMQGFIAWAPHYVAFV